MSGSRGVGSFRGGSRSVISLQGGSRGVGSFQGDRNGEISLQGGSRGVGSFQDGSRDVPYKAIYNGVAVV
jgi:hypothetical protein